MYLGAIAKAVPTFHFFSPGFFTGVEFHTFHTPPLTWSRSAAAEREAEPTMERAIAKRVVSSSADKRVFGVARLRNWAESGIYLIFFRSFFAGTNRARQEAPAKPGRGLAGTEGYWRPSCIGR